MVAMAAEQGLLAGVAMRTGMVRAIPEVATEGVVTVAEVVTDISFASVCDVTVLI
jgi:hypothetical protein